MKQKTTAKTKPAANRRAPAEMASAAALLRNLPKVYKPAADLSTLKEWPGNPKDHDLGAIMESIQENGAAFPIFIQASSRRMIVGHGRKAAALKLGYTTWDVMEVDCDDATAQRLLLIDNRGPQLGGFRENELYAMLREMAESGASLAGSGYDLDDIDDLRMLTEPVIFAPIIDDAAEKELDYKPHETITVLVRNMAAIQPATTAIAELLTAHPAWDAKIAER